VNYQPGYQPHVSGGVVVALIVFYIVVIAFFGWIYVRIVRRTGYSGWWVLMALVPIGNLVVLCLFAFKEWPIQQELAYLRRHASMTGLPGYGSAPQQYGYGQPPGYGPSAPPAPFGGPPSPPAV
jgi:uncharacterized membrane protein YhaH (DUF805 family)